MCGISAVILAKKELGPGKPNNAAGELHESLGLLQHRGQDAAGIVTSHSRRFMQCKRTGLVRDVFTRQNLEDLKGSWGIAHVRYPTAGSSSCAESQPLYVNSPMGIALAHNGNLTNGKELYDFLHKANRHINTNSDSELLLNIFAHFLQEILMKAHRHTLEKEDVFEAVKQMNSLCQGGYSAVVSIAGYGILCFRDSYGIRPLVYGQRVNSDGSIDYCAASETAVLDFLQYKIISDVQPGEAILFTRSTSSTCSSGDDGEIIVSKKLCVDKPNPPHPCIFEYVYFARLDSIIDGISVYEARLNMGEALAAKIMKDKNFANDIDVVIPVPDTSSVAALQCALALGKPYREGFVKNRYVGRTFIMPEQRLRAEAVRRKLNLIHREFRDKRVLIVDDSIVRGTTSAEIVKMTREAGAKKVYFASCSPEVRYPNVYGIDMPTAKELFASDKTLEEMRQLLNVDRLIFQDLDSLKESCTKLNPKITNFDCSVFDGTYVAGNINDDYLNDLSKMRNNDLKASSEISHDSHMIGLHNN